MSNRTAAPRNRVAGQFASSPATAGFNWKWLALAAIACSALMFVGLIGAFATTHGPASDTRLTDVSEPTTTEITSSFNTYHGVQPVYKPEVQPTETPTETVVVQAEPEPATTQTVIVEERRPEPQRTTIIYREPEPTPPEDLTVVFIKPEVREPEHRIVVIDERAERLLREYRERKAAWASRPQSLADGGW